MVLEVDGEFCFDTNKVANYINKFYTTVASDLVDKLPCAKYIFGTESRAFKDYYESKGVTPDCIKLSAVTTDFVYKELL